MKRICSAALVCVLLLTAVLTVPVNAAAFTDVSSSAWYAAAVDYCTERGYFNGTSATTFSPDATMSRAMLVTVLYRHSGDPKPPVTSAFPDVPDNTWYTTAVAWATENRIVNGATDGCFHPNDPVTRQEIMALLHRYVVYRGNTVNTEDSRILDSFRDAGSISNWAKESARWCTSVGIICGSNGAIGPTASSTRAQVATVLMRLDAYLKGELETITTVGSEYGTFVPAGQFRIVTGSSILFRIESAAQYAPETVTLNGEPIPAAGTYTVRSSNGPQVLSASFRPCVGDPYSGYGQLVNRTYAIPGADFGEPADLVIPQTAYYNNVHLREEAAAAADRMIGDYLAEYPESELFVQSGYRTLATQIYLYDRQVSRKDGNIYAAGVVSAVPGTSEHQLGLAIDLSCDGTLEQTFGATQQGLWLAEHCTEYGFILRYPADKERVTGIFYEPWHFRYVGPEIAADMEAWGITTLEEYYGLYLAPEDLTPYLPYLNP